MIMNEENNNQKKLLGEAKRRRQNGSRVGKVRQPPIHIFADDIDWTQIVYKATLFAENYQTETSETAEAQTFWNDFFEIFGRTRRGLAVYEYHARTGRDDKQNQLTRTLGRIDMLWPGVLAVEHKSAGINLDDGKKQLLHYINGLTDDRKPRYGLICNFTDFRLIDFKTEVTSNFTLGELPQNVEKFVFFIEHEREQFALKLEANKGAAELIGNVYDALVAGGYDHKIDRLLMRLLFCMFADSTGIWRRGLFLEFLSTRTSKDGSDLGACLEHIFEILNKEQSVRQKNLDSSLQEFSYINGGLFADRLDIAAFDRSTRDVLLNACRFDWKHISPDIFGALFQSVRDSHARRSGGEHYTSEEDILKIIRPLFLDKLRSELERAGKNKQKLKKLHDKIAALRFLDPACGCGNFLIVAYRELRLLEMEILLVLYPDIKTMNIDALCRVNVNQFYGIEIDSFPAGIAETAMWLVDHQMNIEISEKFGNYYNRIPLTVSPHIRCGNALRIEWESIIPASELSYILGNPPFVDRKNRAFNPEQKKDMHFVFKGEKAGNLDYVAAWYMKTARYISGTDIQCAFVSTDSIVQSMQVGVLWKFLNAEKIKINFAHRSFKWNNQAGNVAQVRVVIIGFGVKEQRNKIIYDYPDPKGEPRKILAATINPYLKDEPHILVVRRDKPLGNVPEMNSGSNPLDNGHLLFSPEEKKEFLDREPNAREFIRPAIGGKEFVNGSERWCLWLEDANSSVFRKIRPIKERLDKVEQYRRYESTRKNTQELANNPHLFGENRQPNTRYLVVPQTSSGARTYIPMGFASKQKIALIKCQVVPKADLYHFGVLTSAMHMAWVNALCGRLGGGYSYTASLVYNTFPWPTNITEAQKEKIKICAQEVLDTRKNHSASLGDMYSNMPRDLISAHKALDIAVQSAYRKKKFDDDRQRLEYLFSEYQSLTAPVIPKEKKRRKRAIKQ